MYHGNSDEERENNKRGTVSHRGPIPNSSTPGSIKVPKRGPVYNS